MKLQEKRFFDSAQNSDPEKEKSTVYNSYDLRTESDAQAGGEQTRRRGLARQLRVLPGVKQYTYMRYIRDKC